jgi:hypothetical protein
MAEG